MTGRSKPNDLLSLTVILTLVVVFFVAVVWLTRRDLLLTIIFFISLLAVIVFITIYLIKRERRYVRQSGIAEVDRMSGRHFAYFLQTLFKKQGFTIRQTVLVGNYGADLILEQAGKRVVVQARRWKNNPGIRVIRDAADAVEHHQAASGIVITNTYFTDQAIELARDGGLELWDRDKLIGLTGDTKS